MCSEMGDLYDFKLPMVHIILASEYTFYVTTRLIVINFIFILTRDTNCSLRHSTPPSAEIKGCFGEEPAAWLPQLSRASQNGCIARPFSWVCLLLGLKALIGPGTSSRIK